MENSLYFNLQRPELLKFTHLYFLVDIQMNLELMSEKQIFNFSNDLVSDKTMLYWTFPSFIHPRSLTITLTITKIKKIYIFRIISHHIIQNHAKHYITFEHSAQEQTLSPGAASSEVFPVWLFSFHH